MWETSIITESTSLLSKKKEGKLEEEGSKSSWYKKLSIIISMIIIIGIIYVKLNGVNKNASKLLVINEDAFDLEILKPRVEIKDNNEIVVEWKSLDSNYLEINLQFK